MSSPSEHIKRTTDQHEMNRLFKEIGGEEAFRDCREERALDEFFSPELHNTTRKELIEKYRDGKLVAVWFRYTRADGTVRLSPKSLLIGNTRHTC